MDPMVFLVIVVVVLVITVSVVVARQRRGVVTGSSPVCVFCLQPIVDTDHVAAMKESAVRELLGRVPTAQPPSTDPLGNPRWFGHADCASKAGADLRNAGKVTGDAPPPRPPGADPKQLVCPVCGHQFRRPDIVVTTEDVARRYGPNAEQCPRCDHIWDAGGPPRHTIRG